MLIHIFEYLYPTSGVNFKNAKSDMNPNLALSFFREMLPSGIDLKRFLNVLCGNKK